MFREGISLNEQIVLETMEKHTAMIEFGVDRKVQWVNEKFASTLGFSAEELIGMPHDRLCLPSFTDSKDYESFWAKLFDGENFQDKILRIGRDGEEVWLEATYMPVEDAKTGSVTSILKVATDITERQTGIEQTIHELQEMAVQLNKQATEGLCRNGEFVHGMYAVAESLERNFAELQELSAQADEANVAAQSIGEIVEQTKQLALRTAEEGEKAEDRGCGFNAVLDAVRDLAHEVEQSIIDVGMNADSISKGVSKVFHDMEKSMKSIRESRERLEQRASDIEEIAVASQHLDSQAVQLNEFV